MSHHNVLDRFSLDGQLAIITGGAGLLGRRHAMTVADLGGTPFLIDISQDNLQQAIADIDEATGGQAAGTVCDITREDDLQDLREFLLDTYGSIDILINNAANNPKVEDAGADGPHWSHLEQFPLEAWDTDLRVGLTGAFLCSRVFGAQMANQGRGVILNIASDLGLIGPDQRIYREPGRADHEQMVKPVTYSVVKAGLIGLTRYLATYWAAHGVRCNAICPGGVYNGQPDDFVQRLTNLIPMGRMADVDEYRAAIAFLISDASSYMTGSVVSVDGGRTAW